MRDPKKPPHLSQRRIATDLIVRRQKLLSEMIFIERSMSSMDFHNFPRLVEARAELKDVNKKLDTVVMKNYIRTIVK